MTTAEQHLSRAAEYTEFPGGDFGVMAVPLYMAEEALAMLREQIARDIDLEAQSAAEDGELEAEWGLRAAARIARGES